MPENAAESFSLALERMHDQSLSQREHQVAVKELLEAHEELLTKQGLVDTRRNRSLGTAISAVLVLVIVVSMGLNVGWSQTASNTAGQANATAGETKEIQAFLATAIKAGCERANERNLSDVRNLRHDRKTLLRERHFLQRVGPLPGIKPYLKSVGADARIKTRTIHEHISSVAAVAVKKDSPLADCSRAFPLTAKGARRLR